MAHSKFERSFNGTHFRSVALKKKGVAEAFQRLLSLRNLPMPSRNGNRISGTSFSPEFSKAVVTSLGLQGTGAKVSKVVLARGETADSNTIPKHADVFDGKEENGRWTMRLIVTARVKGAKGVKVVSFYKNFKTKMKCFKVTTSAYIASPTLRGVRGEKVVVRLSLSLSLFLFLSLFAFLFFSSLFSFRFFVLQI